MNLFIVTAAKEVLFSVISVHIFGLRYSVSAGCPDCTQFAPFICISTFDFLFLAHVSVYFYYYLYFYCPVRQNKVDMYYQDYTKFYSDFHETIKDYGQALWEEPVKFWC